MTIGGSTFSGRGGGDGSRSLATGGFFDNGGGGGSIVGTECCSLCSRGEGSGCDVGTTGGTTGAVLMGAVCTGGSSFIFTSSGSTYSATKRRPPFGGHCKLYTAFRVSVASSTDEYYTTKKSTKDYLRP